MFDLQKIFTTAVVGLTAQGKPSVDPKGCCRYRGPGGLKCALGFSILDADYSKNFEDERPRLHNKLGRFFELRTKQQEKQLDDLQQIHDSNVQAASSSDFIEAITEEFKQFAKDYHLVMPS